MTEWSRSGPTGCDEPHNRRRYGDLNVGHQRSRAVIGESYNLPAAAVACGPSGRPRAARCTRPRLSGYGLPRGRFPGRLSRFGWGRLAVGARGVVGGVRRPTVWGRCYRRPEVAAVSTDAGCAQAIVRPGEDCRRLKQCLMTLGIHGIFQC